MKNVPSAADVRTVLGLLNYQQVKKLSELSGVPLSTLWNIRQDDTRTASLATLGKFWPHLARAGRTAK